MHIYVLNMCLLCNNNVELENEKEEEDDEEEVVEVISYDNIKKFMWKDRILLQKLKNKGKFDG